MRVIRSKEADHSLSAINRSTLNLQTSPVVADR